MNRVALVTTGLIASFWMNAVYAGLFDRQKDPTTLILNQKECTYMKTYRGKMVNGEFIRPDRWVGSKFSIGEPTIIATLKRVDEKTAHFTNVNNIGDGRGVKVYVSKTNDALEAKLSDGSLIMQCTLDK